MAGRMMPPGTTSTSLEACLSRHRWPRCGVERARSVARRQSRAALVALREMLERRKRVLVPTDEDWQEAWRNYAANRPGGPGVVDQLSFLVMRRYGLTQAFTNDQHFRTAGFEPLF